MSDVLKYLLGATATYNQKERTMFGQETTYYEDIKKGSEKCQARSREGRRAKNILSIK